MNRIQYNRPLQSTLSSSEEYSVKEFKFIAGAKRWYSEK